MFEKKRPSDNNLADLFEKFDINSRKTVEFDINKHSAETKEKIAILILKGSFSLLVIAFLYPLSCELINLKEHAKCTVPETQELLSTVWNFLGPIVGFVVAFYFKAKEEK